MYYLVKNDILHRVGRGKYSFGTHNSYVPEVSRKTKILFNKLENEFPYLDKCIWETSVINEFMQHQPGSFYQIIEVEKESMQSVFYFLQELNYSVFIEPSEDIIEKYITSNKYVLIIKPLVSESPTQIINKVPTITLEKLLVDIYSDNVIFSTQQGAEMRKIFNEAFSKYTINISKLLRYAGRKRKKEGIVEYLETIDVENK